MNIYSVSEPSMKEAQHKTESHTISVEQVKKIDVKENPKMLLHFLNNGLRNIMSSLNYMAIGNMGKYFNQNGKKNVLEGLAIYPGYKANFLLAEAGMFLRVDPTNKLIQNMSVLEFINKQYSLHSDRTRDEKRQCVKEALIGKIVMTNYGKVRYEKVEDIEFLNLK